MCDLWDYECLHILKDKEKIITNELINFNCKFKCTKEELTHPTKKR